MRTQATLKTQAATGLVAAGLLLGSQMALADPGRWQRDDRGRYPGAEYDYARVVDVEPIVRNVRITTPRRECWNETRYEEVRYEERGRERDRAGPMILGGLIGAAIGHQFGHGDGRRAATVAGAVVGTAIGHDSAARRDNGYSSRSYTTETRPYDVERCNVRYDEEYERRVDGYRVTYEYNGRTHTTRLPYDPGERIRVRVDVQPDEY